MNTTQNTAVTVSNDLRFTTSKTIGSKTIYVKIRLNDECKNGHQDFAITADLYEAGKPKTDRYHISGGCIHDEIIKFFPEFKIFVDLHLCDYEGIPMYAVENGYYHLINGFNNTKHEESNFENEYCEYYRLHPAQFAILKTSKNKLQFALNLQNLEILLQWKAEANNAIQLLEDMTGAKFLVDSVKTQFNAPTIEQVQEEQERQNNGYYTPEKQQEREHAGQQLIIDKLTADRDKEISKAQIEYDIKIQVLKLGGKKALENCIYYNHSNTLGFNWKSYDNISIELIKAIAKEINLPEGCTITNDKTKIIQ